MCEACGDAVPRSDGETTAAAVRRHARAAGHSEASVRREMPGGVKQRWRAPGDRTPRGPRPAGSGDAPRSSEHDRAKRETSESQGAPPSPGRSSASRQAKGLRRKHLYVLLPLIVAALGVMAGTLLITFRDEAEETSSAPARLPTYSASSVGEALSLSELEGSAWGDARRAMDEGLDGGRRHVLDEANGLLLEFSYSGDPQRDEWRVCTAELTEGTLGEPASLVTLEIADPANGGCYADPIPTETSPTEEPDTPTPSRRSGPERGVHPGSWCGDPGAYGSTDAGTLMQCQYGAGHDYRWRRAS